MSVVMIAFLKGTVSEAWPGRVVLDVSGVGYEVLIPISTFEKLPAGAGEMVLHTVLVVREDAHTLYGFATKPEKDLFVLLTHHVSGIGPKLGLAVLNGSTPSQFRAAVVAQDVGTLSRIKGLGKKTAERIILELKDKMGVTDAWPQPAGAAAPSASSGQMGDAVLALMSLGYKQADALAAMEKAGAQDSVESLVREALKRL
jgi:holliday junction DNA helicase RuvA